MLAMVDGDLAGLEAAVHYWLNLANEGLDESLLPPNMRYRLAGLAPFPYWERDQLQSDLIWFKNNPYFHELRRSYGADTAAIFGGTSGFGGLAYSSLGIGPNMDNRGIAIFDGHYFTDNWARCGAAFRTPAHEMGHLLGMSHRGSSMTGSFGGHPNTSNFAYHTLEPNYRRNEAYGIDLDQHGQRLYTLMSYHAYKNASNNIRGCIDCVQVGAFASPDLWRFFAQADPLHGNCLVVDDSDTQAIQLQCQGAEAWSYIDGEWLPNAANLVTMSAFELTNRAIPLGVDRPSYEDPDNPGQIIQTEFSTRNREQALLAWLDRADNVEPLNRPELCDSDCAAAGRIRCSVVSSSCGDCLPDHFEHVDDECLPRSAAAMGTPLHDGVYGPSGVITQPGDAPLQVLIPLANSSSLVNVEL
jgi:hypothetical protein